MNRSTSLGRSRLKVTHSFMSPSGASSKAKLTRKHLESVAGGVATGCGTCGDCRVSGLRVES